MYRTKRKISFGEMCAHIILIMALASVIASVVDGLVQSLPSVPF